MRVNGLLRSSGLRRSGNRQKNLHLLCLLDRGDYRLSLNFGHCGVFLPRTNQLNLDKNGLK